MAHGVSPAASRRASHVQAEASTGGDSADEARRQREMGALVAALGAVLDGVTISNVARSESMASLAARLLRGLRPVVRRTALLERPVVAEALLLVAQWCVASAAARTTSLAQPEVPIHTDSVGDLSFAEIRRCLAYIAWATASSILLSAVDTASGNSTHLSASAAEAVEKITYAAVSEAVNTPGTTRREAIAEFLRPLYAQAERVLPIDAVVRLISAGSGFGVECSASILLRLSDLSRTVAVLDVLAAVLDRAKGSAARTAACEAVASVLRPIMPSVEADVPAYRAVVQGRVLACAMRLLRKRSVRDPACVLACAALAASDTGTLAQRFGDVFGAAVDCLVRSAEHVDAGAALGLADASPAMHVLRAYMWRDADAIATQIDGLGRVLLRLGTPKGARGSAAASLGLYVSFVRAAGAKHAQAVLRDIIAGAFLDTVSKGGLGTPAGRHAMDIAVASLIHCSMAATGSSLPSGLETADICHGCGQLGSALSRLRARDEPHAEAVDRVRAAFATALCATPSAISTGEARDAALVLVAAAPHVRPLATERSRVVRSLVSLAQYGGSVGEASAASLAALLSATPAYVSVMKECIDVLVAVLGAPSGSAVHRVPVLAYALQSCRYALAKAQTDQNTTARLAALCERAVSLAFVGLLSVSPDERRASAAALEAIAQFACDANEQPDSVVSVADNHLPGQSSGPQLNDKYEGSITAQNGTLKHDGHGNSTSNDRTPDQVGRNVAQPMLSAFEASASAFAFVAAAADAAPGAVLAASGAVLARMRTTAVGPWWLRRRVLQQWATHAAALIAAAGIVDREKYAAFGKVPPAAQPDSSQKGLRGVGRSRSAASLIGGLFRSSTLAKAASSDGIGTGMSDPPAEAVPSASEALAWVVESGLASPAGAPGGDAAVDALAAALSAAGTPGAVRPMIGALSHHLAAARAEMRDARPGSAGVHPRKGDAAKGALASLLAALAPSIGRDAASSGRLDKSGSAGSMSKAQSRSGSGMDRRHLLRRSGGSGSSSALRQLVDSPAETLFAYVSEALYYCGEVDAAGALPDVRARLADLVRAYVEHVANSCSGLPSRLQTHLFRTMRLWHDASETAGHRRAFRRAAASLCRGLAGERPESVLSWVVRASDSAGGDAVFVCAAALNLLSVPGGLEAVIARLYLPGAAPFVHAAVEGLTASDLCRPEVLSALSCAISAGDGDAALSAISTLTGNSSPEIGSSGLDTMPWDIDQSLKRLVAQNSSIAASVLAEIAKRARWDTALETLRPVAVHWARYVIFKRACDCCSRPLCNAIRDFDESKSDALICPKNCADDRVSLERSSKERPVDNVAEQCDGLVNNTTCDVGDCWGAGEVVAQLLQLSHRLGAKPLGDVWAALLGSWRHHSASVTSALLDICAPEEADENMDLQTTALSVLRIAAARAACAARIVDSLAASVDPRQSLCVSRTALRWISHLADTYAHGDQSTSVQKVLARCSSDLVHAAAVLGVEYHHGSGEADSKSDASDAALRWAVLCPAGDVAAASWDRVAAGSVAETAAVVHFYARQVLVSASRGTSEKSFGSSSRGALCAPTAVPCAAETLLCACIRALVRVVTAAEDVLSADAVAASSVLRGPLLCASGEVYGVACDLASVLARRVHPAVWAERNVLLGLARGHYAAARALFEAICEPCPDHLASMANQASRLDSAVLEKEMGCLKLENGIGVNVRAKAVAVMCLVAGSLAGDEGAVAHLRACTGLVERLVSAPTARMLRTIFASGSSSAATGRERQASYARVLAALCADAQLFGGREDVPLVLSAHASRVAPEALAAFLASWSAAVCARDTRPMARGPAAALAVAVSSCAGSCSGGVLRSDVARAVDAVLALCDPGDAAEDMGVALLPRDVSDAAQFASVLSSE